MKLPVVKLFFGIPHIYVDTMEKALMICGDDYEVEEEAVYFVPAEKALPFLDKQDADYVKSQVKQFSERRDIIIPMYESARELLWSDYCFKKERDKDLGREAAATFDMMEKLFATLYPDVFDIDNSLRSKYNKANNERHAEHYKSVASHHDISSKFSTHDEIENRYFAEVEKIRMSHPEGFVREYERSV